MSTTKRILITLSLAAFAVASWTTANLAVRAEGFCPAPKGVCGDLNGDEVANITDVVVLARYLFAGGDKPVACAEPMPPIPDPMVGTFQWAGEGATALLQLNAGGTWTGSTSDDFSMGDPWSFLSPVYGTWERTSETTLKYVGIQFVYGPGGQLVNKFKYAGIGTFANDHHSYTSDGTASVYDADVDPLTAAPNDVFPHHGQSTRISLD